MRINKIIATLSMASVIPLCMTASGAGAGEFFTAAAELTRRAAYYSAGVYTEKNSIRIESSEADIRTTEPIITATSEPHFSDELLPYPEEPAELSAETAETREFAETEESESETTQSAVVISRNITDFDDGLDRTAEGNRSGVITRRTYGKYTSADYITLSSGAQVRNCTSDSNEALMSASKELPSLTIHADSSEPQVLIVHTHATESFEPYQRDYFDGEFPFRSRDSRYNMVAVGTALAESLAENGISVVHDGTLHDYPAYTGAYDRSEETIRSILEEYPSIKVVIDLHRDAISEADGSRIAPVTEINGGSAAQLMIISGCDDGRFNMPNYMENFKLAALIQNSTEIMYPSLARAVLFDYRNYNQHITTGSLLIEIGTHANSLDEALYTAELLGDSMAAALKLLSET